MKKLIQMTPRAATVSSAGITRGVACKSHNKFNRAAQMSQSCSSRSGCFANARQNKNGWDKVSMIAKSAQSGGWRDLFQK
jgi:hypothetical protein